MIIELMHVFLLILISSIFGFSQTKDITVLSVFNETPLFNDGVTYNIVSFDYSSKNATEYLNDGNSFKLGIVTTENALVDVIWEYQSLSKMDTNQIIHSVELNDLNHDQLQDLIVNYNDVDGEFPDQVISAFLINHNNKFQEISETFIKSRYQMLDNSHIKYETPLSMFGRPYLDEDTQKNSMYWVDYYEFQGLKLVNINQKYREFFDTYSRTSSEKINRLLDQIKHHKMTDEVTINQLQLEEYFNQITELKTIIYRSNQVLY